MAQLPRRVAIIGGIRIPFARSFGKYMHIGNQDLMTACLQALVNRYQLRDKLIGEVALGAVVKHSRDWNLARESTLSSGVSAATPAFDVQQACGTSLEATILLANKIAMGQIDTAIAGGTDTNSEIPIVFRDEFAHKLMESFRGKTSWQKIKPLLTVTPKDFKPVIPGVMEPRTGLSMGQSTEIMAKNWKIRREDQDQLALESHQKGAKAYAEGFYNDLITPFNGLDKDDNLRADSSIEKLAKLKPAFDRENGTLTAGNSTPLTDGASAVFMTSEEYAQKHNLPVQCYFVTGQTAAVDFVQGEGLLMAPAFAVPRMLERVGITLQDFDFYEIHEAFAAQVLCTLKAWEDDKFCREKLGLQKALGSIDRKKMNVKGGSLAVGHPFAATGTRIVASLAKILNQAGRGRGLISVCTAGGMGVTAILEK